MTITVLELGLVVLGAMVMAIACTLVGAFVMFRGSSRTPGDSFLGGAPKGQVFSIPDPTEDFPEEGPKAAILARTNEFLKKLGGEGL